ncbi:hypothetical protein ACFVHB_27460 [Kitasatospora sp. NPDC127111]|uniref:hypothetical protein n=1 Tax=Kitasatospora sp. NPDC127111 TaxID=3345363 RepID=UPI0036442624
MDDFDGELPRQEPVFCVRIGAVLDLERDGAGHPGIRGLWRQFPTNGGTLADPRAGDHAVLPRPRHAGPRGRRDAQCLLQRVRGGPHHPVVRPARAGGEPLPPAPAAPPARPERPDIAPVRRGVCSAGEPHCGAEARPYAGGWFCEDHRPGADFGRPGAAGARREEPRPTRE